MTNDDMISRQNVLRCLTDISYNHCKTQGEADVIDTAKTMVAVMSSAQPDLCDGCDRYGASCVGEGCGKLEMPEVAKDTNVPINDCISRQAMFDTAAEYEKQLREILGDENELVEVVKILKHRLIALPSTQPEIIRCRDCISYQEGIDIDGKPFTRCNGSVRTYGHTPPDWYCADAERRTDGTEQP